MYIIGYRKLYVLRGRQVLHTGGYSFLYFEIIRNVGVAFHEDPWWGVTSRSSADDCLMDTSSVACIAVMVMPTSNYHRLMSLVMTLVMTLVMSDCTHQTHFATIWLQCKRIVLSYSPRLFPGRQRSNPCQMQYSNIGFTVLVSI